MRKFMLLILLLSLAPLNGCGNQPRDDQTTPIILKMEESKASRRGKLQLTEEERKDPRKLNERRYADLFVPQYPWAWSAGVLVGLLGISVWRGAI